MARLTTELSQVNAERDDLKRQVFTAKAERDDIASLAERRQSEMDRLSNDIKSLTDDLSRAQAAKTEALVRMEEIESKEVQLEHKEKRLAEETKTIKGRAYHFVLLQMEIGPAADLMTQSLEYSIDRFKRSCPEGWTKVDNGCVIY